MQFELDREDLICLVRGIDPGWSELTNNKFFRKYGSYCGGFVDKWEWDNSKLKDAPINNLIRLWHIYKDFKQHGKTKNLLG